jgi:hypothetical protein
MGVNSIRPLYPFAECIEITTNGATAVDVRKFAAGDIVVNVMARIKTPGTRAAGALNLIVGDDDDGDGFIAAADAKASAGTVYGDDPAESGAYLYDSVKKGGFRKVYAAEGKTLKAVLDAAADTEATVQITVWGFRANLN